MGLGLAGGVVAGGGVADGGGAVLGLEVWVLLGLLIAPGLVPVPGVVLPGGQLALAFSATLGLAGAVFIAWLCSLPGAVLSTHGLISGTEPGVDEGPGVAVGEFPGTVPGAVGVPTCAPVFVPNLPGWLPEGDAAGELEVWARVRPASATARVAIRNCFRMRFSLRENC